MTVLTEETAMISVNLDNQGQLKGGIRCRQTGYKAANFRKEINRQDEEVWEDRLSQNFPSIDIIEKKLTLPLIYALNKADKPKRKRIKKLIRSAEKKPKLVHEVIDFVKKSGGIDYAISVMETYHNKAKEILQSFPDSPYRNSLEDLVQFTIERTK